MVRELAGRDGSARCRAQRLAKRVVAAFVADEAIEDPLQRAMESARRAFARDPIAELSIAEGSPVADTFERERLRRYAERGCRQLSATDWQTETVEIAEKVEKLLTRRFRDYLK